MLITDFIAKVKTDLSIVDSTKDLIISDALQEAMNYCNLPKVPVEASADILGITVSEAYNLIELPYELEPFVRKKVQSIINYESENGTTSVFDVKSIKEGDTNTTYNVDDVSKETIYGLSERDKKTLQRFRRLR